MDVGCTLDLSLDYTLRLWAPTSTVHAISAVSELLVCITFRNDSLSIIAVFL